MVKSVRNSSFLTESRGCFDWFKATSQAGRLLLQLLVKASGFSEPSALSLSLWQLKALAKEKQLLL